MFGLFSVFVLAFVSWRVVFGVLFVFLCLGFVCCCRLSSMLLALVGCVSFWQCVRVLLFCSSYLLFFSSGGVWLLLETGGPCLGCPFTKSPTMLALHEAPDLGTLACPLMCLGCFGYVWSSRSMALRLTTLDSGWLNFSQSEAT